jgi:hypothetical protein
MNVNCFIQAKLRARSTRTLTKIRKVGTVSLKMSIMFYCCTAVYLFEDKTQLLSRRSMKFDGRDRYGLGF